MNLCIHIDISFWLFFNAIFIFINNTTQFHAAEKTRLVAQHSANKGNIVTKIVEEVTSIEIDEEVDDDDDEFDENEDDSSCICGQVHDKGFYTQCGGCPKWLFVSLGCVDFTKSEAKHYDSVICQVCDSKSRMLLETIISLRTLNNNPIKCDSNDCGNYACSVWVDYQNENNKCNTCLDCQAE